MSKFGTKIIASIKGEQRFEQLVILPNHVNMAQAAPESEKGVWDVFSEGLEERYRHQLRRLEFVMHRVANLQTVNKAQFRDVTPQGAVVKEYEFKYQDLRAYAIKTLNGKLVILGGYKNNQDADFSRFRSLKRQYLEFENQQRHGTNNKK